MEILTLLAPGSYVSGEEIARRLQVSRAAVHKRILKLRSLGYAISGEKRRGYLLLSRPDLLVPCEIDHCLASLRLTKYSVQCHPSLPSTQLAAKDLALRGGKDGTLVIAEEQSGGYGRLSRPWASPKGGLWFSLLLRPALLPERTPQITLVMSLAVCRVLENTLRITPVIKWPNDILLNGRKLAGILTEMSAEVGRVNWVVVGVGINANNSIPASLNGTAASLRESAGNVNRPQLLAAILAEFERLYAVFLAGGFTGCEEEYNRYFALAGKRVEVHAGDGRHAGRVKKIDAEGYLWLETDAGEMQRILAGDVTPV